MHIFAIGVVLVDVVARCDFDLSERIVGNGFEKSGSSVEAIGSRLKY